jgi:serine/threonine protein kinase
MAAVPGSQPPEEPTLAHPGRFPDSEETLAAVSGLSAMTELLGASAAESLNRRYEVFREIARGAFGAVVHARDRALDREVALKFLLFDIQSQPGVLDRFLKEARAAARVKHPNLVTLYDIFEGDSGGNKPFLSMEFIDGISLADLVRREGALPVWQARRFIYQAALGLQHIYENGLVHRDIKPANLMVTARDEVVKILDLGIARLTPRQVPGGDPNRPEPPAPEPPPEGARYAIRVPAPPGGQSTVGPQSDLQKVQLDDDPDHLISGTPGYMAPEQWQTSRVDIRADIYSLGCTFYVLLTGHPPFDALSVDALMQRHFKDEPPPIEDLCPDVSRALGAIIRKMLAKRPEDRYQTPAELIRALDRLSQPPPPPAPGTVTTADQFANVLKAERLLTAKQLDALDTELLPRFPEVHPFAQELTRRGWLTGFQVDEILKGAGKELALGGYVLTDLLGEGSFGRVYRARQLLQNREVALKVIRPDLTKDPVAVGRFRREIRAASLLAHSNIASVFTADEEGGKLYLVMELCPGENLEAVVRSRHPVPWKEVCAWVAQVAAGLQHIYEKGLIHRDIKPSNLMLTPAGVKILDLGLARVVSTDASLSSANLTGGAVVGTPHYISPEQAHGETDIDIRSDLYNLGGTMYHLLAGQPPYHGQSSAKVFISQIMTAPRPITEHRKDVPAEVAAIVHKLLAKAPAERFQKPAELLDALKQLPE